MSTATPPPHPLPYRAPQSPGKSLSERINWRIIVFALVMIVPIGSLFYVWLSEMLTGGIHDFGAYKQVDLKAMSTFDMDQQTATLDDIPQKWRALEGQQVMLIGEMWAPREASNGKLTYFQTVYSKTKCCFSEPPLAQHFVDVDVVKGVNAYYYDSLVKVYGKIHVSIRKDPESGVIKSIYHVQADKVEPVEN